MSFDAFFVYIWALLGFRRDFPKIHDSVDVVWVANEMKPCGVKNLSSTVFTLYNSFNCIFLRFKINKLLIFVVGLAIFFLEILYQIGLMLGFFFLFKKAKINFSIELICSLDLI